MRIVFFVLLATSLFGIPSYERALLPSLNQKMSPDYALLKALYEENNFGVQPYAKYPRIPKIIHQIWLGGKVPERYKRLMDSWQAKNPEWTYRLWTDEDVEHFPFVNKKAFMEADNYGTKSDIWRFEILYLHGGLYVDVDFECLRPMDVFHHTADFYVGMQADGVVINALIGSSPSHPLLKSCMHAIGRLKEAPCKHNVLHTTGPYFLTKQILRAVSQGLHKGLVVYPPEFFYPLPSDLRAKVHPELYFRENSFAVHYWSCSWM